MEDTRYKTFWRRFGALLIDGVVIQCAFVASLIFVLEAAAVVSFRWPNLFGYSLITWYFGFWAVAQTYFVGMHAAYGRTLGKAATGISVVMAATHQRPGMADAFLRNGPWIALNMALLTVPVFIVSGEVSGFAAAVTRSAVNVAFWALLLAELAAMLRDPHGRALHDRLAGTIVVKSKYLSADRPVQASTSSVAPGNLGG
ncbi:MAG: RDD family protein [Dehalococcoidia bacterium]